MTTTKALRRASASTPPFAATSTFRPTRSFSTIKSSSIYYSSRTNPTEAREEQEVSLKTHEHGIKTGNVIAVTGGSMLFVVLVIVLVILSVRKYRRWSVRDRGESSKNTEEGIALQTFDEHLRPNGTDGHLISNDAEQQATPPYSLQLPVQATSSEISIHGYVYMESVPT